MSTMVYAPEKQADARSYLSNVVVAARELIAALLAVRPAQAAVREQSSKARVKEIFALYRMARQYDSVMPNLASELRAIAARG